MEPGTMQRRLGFLLATLFLLAGCNKSEVSQLVDTVKERAAESTEKVKQSVTGELAEATDAVQQQLQLAGSMQLELDQPLSTQACYVQFLAQGSGRPTVLQIQSYRAAEAESFPSVFLHAKVDAQTPQELAGRVVAARLFIQPQQDGPTWYAPVGSPVELSIVSVDEQSLRAELPGGTLRSTADAETSITGTLEGVWW
jgi:hypothetical protein